jgi:hypothetical protein
VLNSWKQSSGEADSFSACHRIPRISKFVAVFTRAYHWFLCWAKWVHFTSSYPVSLRSFQCCTSSAPRSSIWPLSFRLLRKSSYSFTFSPTRATYHVCFIIVHFVILRMFSWGKILISYWRVNSYFLGSNTLLSTFFSNTLRLWSTFGVKDQVLHPYETVGKNIVFKCFNLYVFRWKTKTRVWKMPNIGYVSV